MKRIDVMREVAASLPEEALVMCHLQETTYEWNHVRPSDGNLLRLGMGMVIPAGLGLALALPHRTVVALDGEGSVILEMGALATLGRYKPDNLLAIVFDNQSYNSAGSYPSPTSFGADLAGVARACGVENVYTATSVEEVREALDGWSQGERVSTLIVAKITSERADVQRPTIDGHESKYRFVRFVEETEGAHILPTERQKSF